MRTEILQSIESTIRLLADFHLKLELDSLIDKRDVNSSITTEVGKTLVSLRNLHAAIIRDVMHPTKTQ